MIPKHGVRKISGQITQLVDDWGQLFFNVDAGYGYIYVSTPLFSLGKDKNALAILRRGSVYYFVNYDIHTGLPEKLTGEDFELVFEIKMDKKGGDNDFS